MAKCQSCHHGINSTYIRNGSKGSLRKIGYFCCNCSVYYNTDKKLYTVNEKVYTVFRNSQIIEPAYGIQDNENITTISSSYNKKSNISDSNSTLMAVARPRFELGSKAPKASMLVRYIRYLIMLPGFPGILL
jgi:hypothetical protein